jgi:hypothetical protein
MGCGVLSSLCGFDLSISEDVPFTAFRKMQAVKSHLFTNENRRSAKNLASPGNK